VPGADSQNTEDAVRRIAVFTDASGTVDLVRRHIASRMPVRFEPLAQLAQCEPDYHTIIETDLTDTARLLHIKQWLSDTPARGKVIFITGAASRLESTRAYAVGATHVLARPVNGRTLLELVSEESNPQTIVGTGLHGDQPAGIRQAFAGLQGMFASAARGGRIETGPLIASSQEVVREIEAHGLGSWIDLVRKHHSGTYQHCLLVTGLAVGFGHHLRCSDADRQRLSLAGLIHDVGKARVPVAVLEKPSALDPDEMALIRQHPQFGIDVLQGTESLSREMLDVVLQHHEYLDGSGYPLGLRADAISDLVRMITISDVFAALIEKRAYKPALPHEEAYSLVLAMGDKLDHDLVREFAGAVGLT
jgi:putative nucleotidyltransferase with HDIG domain